MTERRALIPTPEIKWLYMGTVLYFYDLHGPLDPLHGLDPRLKTYYLDEIVSIAYIRLALLYLLRCVLRWSLIVTLAELLRLTPLLIGLLHVRVVQETARGTLRYNFCCFKYILRRIYRSCCNRVCHGFILY